MGKKKNKKEKTIQLYTESERNNKITKILMQMATLNLDHVITTEIRSHIMEYIKKGKEYCEIIDLPQYSREMVINLFNDKNKQTFINLKFKKIRIDNENDKNPINKLNTLQEDMF